MIFTLIFHFDLKLIVPFKLFIEYSPNSIIN